MRGLDAMAGGDLQQARAANQKDLTQKMVDMGLNFNPTAVGILAGKGSRIRILDDGTNQVQKSTGLLSDIEMPRHSLEYQIEHKPMTVDGGAALLHDLEASFGGDIYGKNAMQYFGSGDHREKAILRTMASVRGNPDALVDIYRGVPDGVDKINAGDWVTLHPEVAADYGNVIKMQVPARHVTSWPDSLMEFGYYPDK